MAGKIVSKAGLAELLGVSRPTIDKYLAEGMPVETPASSGIPWRIDVGKAFAWAKAGSARGFLASYDEPRYPFDNSWSEDDTHSPLAQAQTDYIELNCREFEDDGIPEDERQRRLAALDTLIDELDAARTERNRLDPARWGR
jgi:phage terminase Nu1 subunit (DNA packaging protein)